MRYFLVFKSHINIVKLYLIQTLFSLKERSDFKLKGHSALRTKSFSHKHFKDKKIFFIFN